MAEPDDFSDSDRAWFEGLRGRPADAKQAEARREGEALRGALRREAARAAERTPLDLSDEASTRRQQRLAQALAGRVADSERRQRRRWFPLAAAASVLGLGVLLLPLLTREAAIYEEPPEMRGGLNVVQQRVPAPRAAAEALAAEWRAAGLAPRLFQRRKVFFVDVDLEPDVAPAAAAIAQRVGLRLERGIGRVEFLPT